MSLNIILLLRDIMSNQTNGFQGSQPFIKDKQFQNLSLNEIRHIIEQEKEELQKDYNELGKRRKLIRDYKKLMKLRKEVKQGIDIKKKFKKKSQVKITAPSKKIKTFNEYFEECIKNKKIPKDTPSYLREALKRAMKEYDQRVKKEKSALEDFAVKYIIEGKPGIKPVDYFNNIYPTLKDFFKNNRNIKFNMVFFFCRIRRR